MCWPLLLLLLTALTARAEHLAWGAELPEGHVARLEIVHESGERVARLLVADGSERSALAWCPDRDPRPGRVRIELDQLWLAPGRYTLRALLPDGVKESSFEPSEARPRTVLLQAPLGGEAVVAWRVAADGGHDGLAWAPVAEELAFLPLGPGRWTADLLGAPAANLDILPDMVRGSFKERGPRADRAIPRRTEPLFRLALLPLTALLLGLAGLGVRRAWRFPGLPLAAVFAVIAALIAVAPTLSAPGELLISEGGRFTDPADSVAQIAAVAESLPALSDWTRCYSFPEGAAWSTTGPNWLGYLLPVAMSWVVGPVAAHNLSVATYLALLFLLSWGLARTLGARRWPALIAGGCAVLAPVVMEELDVLSIDRATLFTVPLFLLCLHRAEGEGGRRWAAAAGVALAAAFYGQVHYGLYLLAALPLLVLPRLLGPRPLERLLRVAIVGGLALALMAPGLVMLVGSTESANLEAEESSLAGSGADLLAPFGQEEVLAFLEQYDSRVKGDRNPPMGTPKERLLTAISRSQRLEDILQPDSSIPGRDVYWALVLLGLWALRRRRGAALASWDVAVFCLLALGPFLRVGDGVSSVPLPYYLDFLLIPGFEKLKQVSRFMLMAATVAGVPLALAVQGFGERLAPRLEGRLPPRGRLAAGAGGSLLALLALILVAEAEPVLPEYRPIDAPLDEGWGPPKLELFFQPVSTIDAAVPAPMRELEPGGALLLPLDPPLPRAASVAAAAQGLLLVNHAPYGSPARGPFPFWYEQNAFLNAVALAAGTERAKRLLPMASPQEELRALREAGLHSVVMYREHMAGPELAAEAEALLDRHLERVGDDGAVVTWAIPGGAPR